MSDSGALAVMTDQQIEEPRAVINLKFSRKVWGLIFASGLIVGLIAMTFTFFLPSQYVTKRTLLVLSGANPNDNETIVATFEQLIGTPGFATELKQRTGLKLPVSTINGMVSVNRPPSAAILEVAVQWTDLKTTERVSEQILPTLRSVLEANQRQLPIEQRIPGPIVQELFQNPIREVVFVPWYIGFAGGFALGFLIAFGIASFRSTRDVADALDLPVLARLTAMGDGRSSNPQDAVLGMLAAIERLGTNGPIHRLVVIGPDSDLERSKLVLALGCAIARNFDQPVALIDGDLEHGMLTKLIGASDEPGLAECLTGELRVDQTLLRLENGHTPAMLAGMVPPSGMIRVMPAGLNRGGSLLRMRSNLHQVLGGLSGRYVVIVDGPQVPGPVPSTQLLSMADATIVVVTEGGTTLRDARIMGDSLRSLTTNPTGVVVLKK
jgi:Mrp family chromosome partitioning ATPase